MTIADVGEVIALIRYPQDTRHRKSSYKTTHMEIIWQQVRVT